MESTWQKRLEELRQRESQFNEKLSKKETEAEQQLYAHRQRMLSDMEVIRRRDAESRRQAEDARRRTPTLVGARQQRRTCLASRGMPAPSGSPCGSPRGVGVRGLSEACRSLEGMGGVVLLLEPKVADVSGLFIVL